MKIKNKLKNLKYSKVYFYIVGGITGIANGLFGSGGGMLSVPLLENTGLEAKKAHASSIAITLPLSLISTAIYSIKGHINYSLALKFIPLGILGAIAGSWLLKRISNKILKKIFGIILIISGIRMLML